MTSIGNTLILRSNWLLYLQEFKQAAKHVNLLGDITKLPDDEQPLTPFEAKYQASGQVCWQLSLKR
jgi:hypothetical protein